VTRAGLFVELDETGADGFIPARSIGEEYFRFHEAGRAFVGRSATHRLGDPVTVELVETAPVAGALRFRLVDRHAGRPAGTTKRAGHPPRQGTKFGAKSGSKSARGRHGRARR
jgi:ribonuclease R